MKAEKTTLKGQFLTLPAGYSIRRRYKYNPIELVMLKKPIILNMDRVLYKTDKGLVVKHGRYTYLVKYEWLLA